MIERDDMEGVAAEYVLGTLDAADRWEVEALRKRDLSLHSAIEAWEVRLSPLVDLMAPVAPSANLFGKIERRIAELQGNKKPALTSRRPWQALALAASVVLLFVAGALLREHGRHPQLTATLSSPTSGAMFLVRFDAKTDEINVRTLASPAATDKDYELWLIPQGEKKPKVIGIIAAEAKEIRVESPELANEMPLGTLAVSLEPKGGSIGEGPSGPVLVTGKFEGTTL